MILESLICKAIYFSLLVILMDCYNFLREVLFIYFLGCVGDDIDYHKTDLGL